MQNYTMVGEWGVCDGDVYLRGVSRESRLRVFMVMASVNSTSLAGEARASLWDREGCILCCCSRLSVA